MTDMSTTARGATHPDAIRAETPFSYCCECGTYDAHTAVCTCCGFDFRGDVAADQYEAE